MGSMVVAEGETGQGYYECRKIDYDLVQGYLFQKPQLDLSRLSPDAHTLKYFWMGTI